MFTGIVQGTAKVVEIKVAEMGRLVVAIGGALSERESGVKIGDSVAINGVCLTVVKIDGDKVAFDVMGETLKRTNLGELKRDGIVNYELSLKPNERISGHFVTGHVDGTGKIGKIERTVAQTDFYINCNERLLCEIVERGSVALDGISLTVAEVLKSGFRVAIIPHTLEVTNLKFRKVGDTVNIETDIIAKYVRNFLTKTESEQKEKKNRITEDFLKEQGFL
ncbi:MAG: riboflavin synthase [Planctomycetota bacterium]|nr:riboflavin synthase [Planctomycetota bacterium]